MHSQGYFTFIDKSTARDAEIKINVLISYSIGSDSSFTVLSLL